MFRDILDYDITKFPAVIYLGLIFFISRAPFIDLGFSAFTDPTDQDVLAVVNSAYLLRYEHVYTVSRFPGYPFFEMFNSLLIGGGWVFTNIATSIVSLISVVLFGKILNIFEIKNRALLLLTFAFIPVVWINSTITMDYMWALMFILFACLFAFTDRYFLAGIALGFAIGTRFTSGFMILPVVLWALSRKMNRKEILTFITASTGTSALLFLPVFYKYRLEFLQGSGFLYTTPIRSSLSTAAESSLLALNNMALELFGIAALSSLILFAVLNFKNRPHDAERKHLLNFCSFAVLIFILLYFIFPYKVAYLIPIIPWGLIILNEKLKKKFTVIICILLLLNSAVSIKLVDEVAPAVKLDSGVVIKNYEERKSGIEQSKEYMESLSSVFSE